MLSFSHDFDFENSTVERELMSDAFDSISQEYKSGEVGYYTLPHDSQLLISEIDELLKSNRILSSDKIINIAVIGIGGSSLGIKAIDSLMGSKNIKKRDLYFFENSDPIDISRKLKQLKKENTIFIVISKSGSTIETTSIFKTVIDYYCLDIEGDDSEHIFVITDKDSSLSKFAKHYNITQFNIGANIGGRFSVLSAVGIVPLSLAGYDTQSLLEGAEMFLNRFFNHQENHLLEKACFYYEHNKSQGINVLFSYANDLEHFTKWYVQIWGESLGKIDESEHSVGGTPIGLIGSVDQHSFLQLLIEGPKDKTVTFINIKDFENDLKIPNISLKYIEKTDFINNMSYNTLINAQCDATKESLKQSGVAVDRVVIEKISERNIGALIIYYELLTSLVGTMLNINTYNQPGVELGKEILYKKFEKNI